MGYVDKKKERVQEILLLLKRKEDIDDNTYMDGMFHTKTGKNKVDIKLIPPPHCFSITYASYPSLPGNPKPFPRRGKKTVVNRDTYDRSPSWHLADVEVDRSHFYREFFTILIVTPLREGFCVGDAHIYTVCDSNMSLDYINMSIFAWRYLPYDIQPSIDQKQICWLTPIHFYYITLTVISRSHDGICHQKIPHFGDSR